MCICVLPHVTLTELLDACLDARNPGSTPSTTLAEHVLENLRCRGRKVRSSGSASASQQVWSQAGIPGFCLKTKPNKTVRHTHSLDTSTWEAEVGSWRNSRTQSWPCGENLLYPAPLSKHTAFIRLENQLFLVQRGWGCLLPSSPTPSGLLCLPPNTPSYSCPSMEVILLIAKSNESAVIVWPAILVLERQENYRFKANLSYSEERKIPAQWMLDMTPTFWPETI